jgi:hypothetical protein
VVEHSDQVVCLRRAETFCELAQVEVGAPGFWHGVSSSYPAKFELVCRRFSG